MNIDLLQIKYFLERIQNGKKKITLSKQIYFYFICVVLWSCSTGKYSPIPNEKLVHIQPHPYDDTDTNMTQIYGCVKEYKSDEPVLFGSVVMYKNGVLKQVTETNFDGEFFLNFFAIDSTANYIIEFGYVGFYPLKIEHLFLQKGLNYELECTLAASKKPLDLPPCWSYEVPLIEQDNTTSGQIFTSDQIKRSAARRN